MKLYQSMRLNLKNLRHSNFELDCSGDTGAFEGHRFIVWTTVGSLILPYILDVQLMAHEKTGKSHHQMQYRLT